MGFEVTITWLDQTLKSVANFLILHYGKKNVTEVKKVDQAQTVRLTYCVFESTAWFINDVQTKTRWKAAMVHLRYVG